MTQTGRSRNLVVFSWGFVAAVLVMATLGAQTPLVTEIPLPPPACGGGISGIADCDSNGLPDFVVVASTSGSPGLAILKDAAAPGGGWCIPSPIDPLTSPLYISCRLANLNADDVPDVVVTSAYENRILDGLGTGNGGFTFPGTGAYGAPSTGGQVSNVAILDFDLDGLDDVVVYRQAGASSMLELFRNLGSGWALAWSYLPTATPNVFATGDFDGDGRPDLIWTENAYEGGVPVGRLMVALATAGPQLVPQPAVPIGFPSQRVLAVGDLDADGHDDVVLSGQPGYVLNQGLPIVYGVPAGTPATVTYVFTPFNNFANATILDLDQDGVLDLVVEAGVVATQYVHPIALFRGLGARAFSGALVLANVTWVPLAITSVFQADVDGDHDVDLVRSVFVLPGGPGSFDLLRNETRYASGCAGTGGIVPSLSTGVAHPGNSAFSIGVHGALHNRLAVLGVSLSRVPVSGCGIGIDASPSQLLLPFVSQGVTMTNGVGNASIGLGIPASPAFSGLVVYAQWGVEDPNGALALGSLTFATTAPHTILVW